MKITVMTGLFAKWNVDVDAAHISFQSPFGGVVGTAKIMVITQSCTENHRDSRRKKKMNPQL